eukprot:14097281-Heterocapsa_arctica.AAC.1
MCSPADQTPKAISVSHMAKRFGSLAHGHRSQSSQVRNMVDASSQRDIRDASVYSTFMLPKLYMKM